MAVCLNVCMQAEMLLFLHICSMHGTCTCKIMEIKKNYIYLKRNIRSCIKQFSWINYFKNSCTKCMRHTISLWWTILRSYNKILQCTIKSQLGHGLTCQISTFYLQVWPEFWAKAQGPVSLNLLRLRTQIGNYEACKCSNKHSF